MVMIIKILTLSNTRIKFKKESIKNSTGESEIDGNRENLTIFTRTKTSNKLKIEI